MVNGLSFRKDCLECGHTFLTPDRQRKFCPKCLERVAAREEQKRKTKEKGERKALQKTATPQQPPPALGPVPEELKAQIISEFEIHREKKDLPQRKIHGLIAKKLKVKKRIVAQALGGVADKFKLTEEAAKEIILRYQNYLMKLERPEKGRRKTIAAELGIPFRNVAQAIREWKRGQLAMASLTRQQRFYVEKSYFRNLRSGKTPLELAEKIAIEMEGNRWQVLRYLDLLHDGKKLLRKVDEVTPEQKEAIITGYFEYLSAPAPPEPFLHTLLAEKAGVDHKQVHKVLLDYRLDRLKEITNPAAL